jgi:hypothetical protein
LLNFFNKEAFMHIVKKYQTAVTLFSREGGVWHYSSIRALVKDVGLNWVGSNVADHFRVFSYAERRTSTGGTYGGGRDAGESYLVRIYKDSRYILRDDAGKVVSYSTCWNAVREPWRAVQVKRSSEGPVEGTGKRRNRYHRRRGVRFINAVRAAETFCEEGEVAVRTARGVDLLQSRWDSDYWYGHHMERSWKKFRKTQWK